MLGKKNEDDSCVILARPDDLVQLDYRESLMTLLKQRGLNKTICPSEILPNELKKNKILMEHVRTSAKSLAIEGLIEITQSGSPVDPLSFKGPIRLRLKKG